VTGPRISGWKTRAMAETTEANDRQLTHLAPAETHLGAAFARPRLLAIACIVALAALGWVYLALMTAGMIAHAPAGQLGPGMGIFDVLLPHHAIGPALFSALCRPTFGSGAWASLDFVLVWLMWCAMALAMMLPTAGPMILAYAEIADTAARKGERVVSPLALAAGYCAVWLGFAVVAALLQGALTRAALIDASMASVSTLFSGAVFIGAGLYQFSSLKHACVTLCQRPLPFFFANWQTTTKGVFRLGVTQGLYCLGCCWAMMLVMFAVGVMNVVWMAALGMIMTAEKVATTTRFSRVVGAALVVIGAGIVVTSVIAHWPGPAA
jgi:predicted metal-binding membrane protein